MLKLTSALITKAEAVRHRLVTHLSPADAKLGDQRLSSRLERLDSSVVSGLFILIDKAVVDNNTQRQSFDSERLLNDFENAIRYLRRLKISECVELFLAMEKLVMASGDGVAFQRWRIGWQRALLRWVERLEGSRHIVEHLGALTPLSTVQAQRLQEQLSLYHQWASILLHHLSAYVDGRSALPPQVVLSLDLGDEVNRPLISATISKSLSIHQGIEQSGAHQRVLYPAHSDVPLASFYGYLIDLFASAHVEPWAFINPQCSPLLSYMIQGGSPPEIYAATPALSRGIWLKEELRQVLTVLDHTPTYICIPQAESLRLAELRLWTYWIECLRERGHPFALILMSSTEEDSSNLRLIDEVCLSQRIHYQNVTLSAVNAVDQIRAQYIIDHWDQSWSTILLDHFAPQALSHTENEGHSYESLLWSEVIDGLSAELKAYLILQVGLGHSLLRVNHIKLAQMYPQLSKRLQEAGWLVEIAGQEICPLGAVNQWVKKSLARRESLSQTYPLLLETMLSMLETAQGEAIGGEVLLAIEYRSTLQQWLSPLPVSPLPVDNGSHGHPSSSAVTSLIPRSTSRLRWLSLSDDGNSSDRVAAKLDQAVLQPSLREWVSTALVDLRRRHWFEDTSVMKAHIQRLKSATFALGDLEALAQAMTFQVEVHIENGDLSESVIELSTAHHLFSRLGVTLESMACRLRFLTLLVQVGFQELAQHLLRGEMASLGQDSPHLKQWYLTAGMSALHRQEYLEALAHFTKIKEDSGDVTSLQALATLKCSGVESHLGLTKQQSLSQTARQRIQSAKTLSLDAYHKGLSSYDMLALNAWVYIQATSILGEVDLAIEHLDVFEYSWNLDYAHASRGDLYRQWSYLTLAPALLAREDRSPQQQQRLEDAKNDDILTSLTERWHSGYKELSSLLVERSELGINLISPLIPTTNIQTLLSALSPKKGSVASSSATLWELIEPRSEAYSLFRENG